jgi:hypothetical protein
LHDLGEFEVKHGVRVSVVNLYTEELGNPAVPEKFKSASVANGVSGANGQRLKRAIRSWTLIGALVVVVAAVAGFYFFSHRTMSKSQAISSTPAGGRTFQTKASRFFHLKI